jgi:zinc protease
MSLTVRRRNSIHSPQITRLNNGLTIIAEQIPVEAVNLNIWFNVGSAIESDDINGMAHFLEHMIFKGTKKLKVGEFERFLETRGALTNAATSHEYTHYYFTSAPQDFSDILPLQLDLVCNPLIPEEEFERERMVVLEEIRRANDNPGRRLSQKMMDIAFPHLPYSRPILGSDEIINNLTAKQMQSFHGHFYQPCAMTVVAVGNLPVEDLTQQIIDNLNFDSPSLDNSSFLKSYPIGCPFSEIIDHEYVDNSLQQSRLILMWAVPGFMDSEDSMILDVLAVILGRGKLSRLFRDLRENRHLVHRISASNMTYKMHGVFSISAQLQQDDLETVQTAILDHLQQIQTQGVTQKELDRVCQNVANQFIFQSEKPSDRTNLYGYYYSQLQTIAPALQYVEKIRQLRVKDIQEVAIKYFPLDAYGVVKALDK